MSVRILAVLIFLGVAVENRGSIALEYWPTDESKVYTYVNSSGDTLATTYGPTRTVSQSWTSDGYMCDLWDVVAVDDGRLFLYEENHFCEHNIDPTMIQYSPPILFLDATPSVGDFWRTDTSEGTYMFSVLADTTITVPYGTFHTLQLLRIENFVPQGSYFLNRDVGPVMVPDGFRLVSVESTVSTESVRWSALKARY